MEVVAAATLYGLFSAWLLFPYFGVRRMLTTSAAVLTWLEFFAVLTWGYSREDCARGSCSALAEAARAAVAVDLPTLSIALVALAVADAVRRWRGSPRPDRATQRRTPLAPSESPRSGESPCSARALGETAGSDARHGVDAHGSAT